MDYDTLLHVHFEHHSLVSFIFDMLSFVLFLAEV
jgi:hypothetical protein